MNAVAGSIDAGRSVEVAAPDFITDFLAALADRVVMLDAVGRVTSLSEAPTAATPTMASQTLLRPGLGYVALCRRAEAAGLAAAGAVADAVTALLWGTRPDVQLELQHPARCLELQATLLQTGPGAVLVHRDTTAAAARLRELRELAYSDTLTGLHNRHYFFREAGTYLRGARQDGCGAALVYLDLDGFKLVNDTYGHAVGDEVLAIMGARLRGLLRSGDLLARLGGDEFVFLVRVENARAVESLVERVRHTLRQPVALGGVELRLSVSVGTALASESGDAAFDTTAFDTTALDTAALDTTAFDTAVSGNATPDDVAALLETADRAMYAAKRRRA